MGKKVREYKAGDFIFAKVKGYPAWPARVQRMNGKKYFVYFYGTGETANLPPNMIFDYAENKDKFLNKAVKRRDFNDGVKQIEYDFANNVPLEQVIGVPLEVEEGANDTVNESAANDTVDESMADTTAVDETMAEENTTQNDTGIEDSDETGALVIDEGKQGKTGKKPTPKTPAKETPKAKEPKTPRGRAKKDEEAKEELKEDDNKKDEELVSRSGRKIRPKRYIDEHTEENTTLPSSAPKKRRAASPVEKDKENKEKDGKEKNIKQFNAVTRSELEDLKEPFTTDTLTNENMQIQKVFFDKDKSTKIKSSKKFRPPLKNKINKTINGLEIDNLPIDCKGNTIESVQIDDLKKELLGDINIAKQTFEKRTYSKSNTKFSLNGILLGSLNVLNDDGTDMPQALFSQDFSQEQAKASQESKETILSRTESFNSVISINKIYKNLDMKSCENIQKEEHNSVNSKSQIEFSFYDANSNNDTDLNHNIDYKIPTGDVFLNLFKAEKSRFGHDKMVPMSIQFGDIGLNLNYSDYIKGSGHFEEADTSDVVSKILEMYPKENEIQDPEKENIIIAYLPAGQYIGIKLFQSRPTTFKNDSARLQWDKQAARNALTLKSQLEKGHITPQSVLAQLVMDLNLTDEEKATLDKDRETEEKKSRVHFLKVEMKLIELDAKIKTCLCLEKADTELCLKLLDELMALDIKPLMLLKHPTTPETIKRMRAYVGNTPSWELTENAALLFSQHAHKIRKQADIVYANLRKLFNTPEGLSFWEFFTERVEQFKKATEKYTSDEILEMVHEPLEMSFATSHTMRAAIDAANEQEKEEADEAKKAKPTPAKTKKVINNGTPKTPAKRQSSRNKPEEKDKEKPNTEETSQAKTEQSHVEQKNETESKEIATEEKEVAKDKREKKSNKDSKSNKEDNTIKDKDSKTNKEDSKNKEKDSKANNEGHIIKDKDSKANKDDNKSKSKDSDDKELRDTNDENDSEVKEKTPEKADESTDDSKQESSVEVEKSDNLKEISKETDKDSKSAEKEKKSAEKERKSAEKERKSAEKERKSAEKERKSAEKEGKSAEKEGKSAEKESKSAEKESKSAEKESKSAEKESKSAEKESKSVEKETKSAEKESKSDKKSDREDKRAEKEKTEDEPRAKRSRESKKTDPPPRSPTKRKSKF
ncbi:jg17086 [Pararge aegeria aegeria]|uniref:Jg17086 protein n=2 Tax=Pararge aegeria TaxID=116150 RepID=A0A8S4R0V8_9NEOP|nr:jg17086 [Pararge aegeria aegeria]